MAYGGTVNPPRNRKGGDGNPPPTSKRARALSRPHLWNPNPDAPVTAPITLRGTLQRVVDIDIPGGLPAPIKTGNGKTTFPLRLQPAGMTVLRLDR